MPWISKLIGKFGKYQVRVWSLLCASMFCVGFHDMSIIFLALPVMFTCPNNKTCCDNPEFNKSMFTRTIVTEWNLICTDSWLIRFTQTTFNFGILIGSLIFGLASDRFGRRPTMLFAVILQLFTGIISSYLPDYWSFISIRMILGFSVGGILVVGYVMVLEYTGNEYRDITSALFHIPYGIGIILLALLGYFITDYVHLELIITMSGAVLLSYICLLPESPRWLLAVDKTTKAITLMERIAKINNLPCDGIEKQVQIYRMEHLKERQRKETALDIIRTPFMRLNTFIISIIWFTIGCCYTGGVYCISQISADIHIYVMACGMARICGCLMAIPLLRFMERRALILFCNIISAACLFINCVIAEGTVTLVLWYIEILLSVTVFVVIFLYCAESFPTTVRNSAVGIASSMACFAPMITPYIAALKYYGNWCLPLVLGVLSLFSALSTLKLPEVSGTNYDS